MRIKYTKQALKALSSYDEPTRNLIREKILGLTEKPPKGDIKSMQGLKNELRLRVGKYRVIYEYTTENDIEILIISRVGTRGDIYKR